MRNLLIIQTSFEQHPSDWIVIKQPLDATAPDVEVAIANNRHRNSALAPAGAAPVISHSGAHTKLFLQRDWR
jgi:hypothetical protein